MDIKTTDGRRVGYNEGDVFKDTYGNRVCYIEGNAIKDTYGNRLGYMEGDIFKDNFGTRISYMEGSNIKDTYGNRIGYIEGTASEIQKCAAAFALMQIVSNAADTSSSSSYSGGSSSSEKPGCLGMILAFFVKIFIKSSIGGKIGGVIGVVIMIVSTIVGKLPIGNLIFLIPMLLLIGIGIGTFIGFILRKSSRTGKFGALIGAGILGLAGGILTLLGSKPNVSDFLMVATVGIVVGFFLGIAIGAIVHVIQKKKSGGQ